MHNEERKMTKTMSYVIGSFLLCWMPITLYFLAIALTENRLILISLNDTFAYVLHVVSILATHMNSAIDPIIYAYQMKQVRSGIKKIFKLESLTQAVSSTTNKI